MNYKFPFHIELNKVLLGNNAFNFHHFSWSTDMWSAVFHFRSSIAIDVCTVRFISLLPCWWSNRIDSDPNRIFNKNQEQLIWFAFASVCVYECESMASLFNVNSIECIETYFDILISIWWYCVELAVCRMCISYSCWYGNLLRFILHISVVLSGTYFACL